MGLHGLLQEYFTYVQNSLSSSSLRPLFINEALLAITKGEETFHWLIPQDRPMAAQQVKLSLCLIS
jgi:hypothetical protein